MTEPTKAVEAFTHVYETDHWSGGSGVGSRSNLNAAYISLVEALIAASDIKAVVDAGCGDWQFSQLIDWSRVSYRGFDAVDAVIAENNKQFRADNVVFQQLDFSDQELPAADLLICKDVLQHWPIAAIRAFLDRNVPRFRYALITNDVASVHSPPERQNADISFGEWRVIDLAKPPISRVGRASVDLDYCDGEWTKRATLFCSPSRALRSRFDRNSGLSRFRRASSKI